MYDYNLALKKNREKRKRQKQNLIEFTHPKEKTDQIRRILESHSFNKKYKILELFCGSGNLTQIYKTYGNVSAYDKAKGDGDSYLIFHKLISERKKFDLIDIDTYGYPGRFLPDIFLLIKKGYLFLTFCKDSKPNRWNRSMLNNYFGSPRPRVDDIIKTICKESMKQWRETKLIEYIDLGKVYRFVFSVERINCRKYFYENDLRSINER